MSEMDPKTYVELHWLKVRDDHQRGAVLAYRPGGGEFLLSGNPRVPIRVVAAAWLAASMATEAQKGRVNQVDEEIEWLIAHAPEPLPYNERELLTFERLLSGRRAEREALMLGMWPSEKWLR